MLREATSEEIRAFGCVGVVGSAGRMRPKPSREQIAEKARARRARKLARRKRRLSETAEER